MTMALEGVRGQCQAPAALYPQKDQVPIGQKAGWAPGPVWTEAENLAPTGIRSPNRPARSQSLYRLSYPAHFFKVTLIIIIPKSFVYVLLLLQTFWDPKNVHFYLMYLKHDSIIGLMMNV